MRPARISLIAIGLVAAACGATNPPAVPAAPAFPEVPALHVPDGLIVPADARTRLEAGWRRFQSNDLRGAARDYAAALARAPEFYPAETGLGYVAFQERRWDEAIRWFDAALARNGAYAPALAGRVEAALSTGDEPGAIAALERWIAVVPAGPPREELTGRLDVLRLRVVQAELSAAAASRDAGRLDEAQATLERARRMAPGSAVVLRELARVEIARGAFDAAEADVREALTHDPGDPETHAVLGEVLEAHGRLRDAADAFRKAAALEPRAEWVSRAATLASRADMAALPAEYRAIPSAQTVTRAQVAAVIGVRLAGELARAPRRVTVVLTDIRSHWAAPWIVPVTRAGLMEAFPNHTFQPGVVVRRADLAQIAWRAIQVLGAHRSREIAQWRAARPVLADVPRTHLAFADIAAAVASGTVSPADATRFLPNRPVTGAEVLAAVARLEQIASGGGR